MRSSAKEVVQTEWREVRWYPGLYASDDGRVRYQDGVELKQHRMRCNGATLVYTKYGNLSVSRCVYLAWHGDIPDGMVVKHKDKNKDNNHADNLILGRCRNADDRVVLLIWPNGRHEEMTAQEAGKRFYTSPGYIYQRCLMDFKGPVLGCGHMYDFAYKGDKASIERACKRLNIKKIPEELAHES